MQHGPESSPVLLDLGPLQEYICLHLLDFFYKEFLGCEVLIPPSLFFKRIPGEWKSFPVFAPPDTTQPKLIPEGLLNTRIASYTELGEAKPID